MSSSDDTNLIGKKLDEALEQIKEKEYICKIMSDETFDLSYLEVIYPIGIVGH